MENFSKKILAAYHEKQSMKPPPAMMMIDGYAAYTLPPPPNLWQRMVERFKKRVTGPLAQLLHDLLVVHGGVSCDHWECD